MTLLTTEHVMDPRVNTPCSIDGLREDENWARISNDVSSCLHCLVDFAHRVFFRTADKAEYESYSG